MKHKVLRSYNIREANEKLVLSILQKNSGVSQSEVVQLTGLKAPTVFRIFTLLEEAGIIQRSTSQPVDSEKKGRRPVYYSIVPSAYYIIGIDLWSRSAAIVIEDFSGHSVYQHIRPLTPNIHAQESAQVLCDLIGTALSATNIPTDKILGIGIAAPGRVDITTNTVLYYSRIAEMENFPLGEIVERRFSIPVTMHNNAAAVALAAYRYGIAHESPSILTILIRSGVGGSFIHEKKIMVSNGATTLELGHMSLHLDGENCECGGQGCVESYLSEDAFLEEFSQVSQIQDITDLDRLSADEIPTAVLDIIHQKGTILAQTMRNLYYLFGPHSFLIVTRSNQLSKILATQAETILSKDSHLCSGIKLTILTGSYDPAQACRGAADLVLDDFFG